MPKLLLIIFFSLSPIFAQSPFFSDPRISGTPFLPSDESTFLFFENIKNTSPVEYQRLTNLRKKSVVIGDERNFNVRNFKKEKYESKVFVLKRSEELINIWVEKAELNNNHVTETIIDNILNGLIENSPQGSYNSQKGIFEIELEVYGTPPDKDSNNKVDFLLTDIIDDWDGSGAYIGGFFSSYDQTNNPGSNRADIMYIDTYPGIYSNNNGNDHYNISGALGTVAHELQHLIQFANDPDEVEWVNEGLSELASFLCGYKLRSPDLYLKNSDLQITSWDDENVLAHYSKVAVWTYFLFESYGVELINEISRNGIKGIDGINASLISIGAADNFDSAVEKFFKILVANDPQVTPDYAFKSSFMQNFTALPQYRAIDYPFKKVLGINPYSIQSVQYTNGDSIAVNFDYFNGIVLRSKQGFGTSEYMDPVSFSEYTDNQFGISHHSQTIYFLNNTSQTQKINISANANIKYDLITLQYGDEEPTYSLTSTGNTNAIQYFSSQENAFIKSVIFYNSGTATDIMIHSYNQQLNLNPQPQFSLIKKNVVISDWVSFDLEDLHIYPNNSDYFNVGIEFKIPGAMGYEALNGNSHSGKSWIKQAGESIFRLLNAFSLDDDIKLNGVWMIRLEIAVPYSGSKENNPGGKIEDLKIYPIPFIADKESMNIEYTLANSSPVFVDIYNIAGQLVYTYTDNLGSGSVTWNGKNNLGNNVASGVYLLSIGTKSIKIHKRIVLLR